MSLHRLPLILGHLETCYWLRNGRESLVRVDLLLAVRERHVETLRILHLQDVAQGLVAVYEILAHFVLRLRPRLLDSAASVNLVVHGQAHCERVARRSLATQSLLPLRLEIRILKYWLDDVRPDLLMLLENIGLLARVQLIGYVFAYHLHLLLKRFFGPARTIVESLLSIRWRSVPPTLRVASSGIRSPHLLDIL